ncbi:hypothetical protein M8C13_07175 [Crossiella sp. SN42]|uniref:hypothetical protein n=1 Tax=Crossiella sp. SN42 TaxID=2944808 RepID=UPI00207CD49C|nr:hypothetical protein [Crossiella sp. SN42]MCO1575539.1 hypothetical protein [Crossiella sp. SN42]
MKRSLYRRLHHTLHPYLGHRTAMRVATAVFTVPDPDVPRWTPGPGWIEMATGRYWVRAEPEGERGLLHTWTLDAHGHYTDQPALVSGVTDCHAAIVDKAHRAYDYLQAGTMRIVPCPTKHPAHQYWQYVEAFTEKFGRQVKQLHNAVDYPLGYRTLYLQPRVELRLDGRSWVCSVEVALSPERSYYWWDLARATDVLSQLVRHYRVPHIALYCETPYPVTNPLWHRGWAELDAYRAARV